MTFVSGYRMIFNLLKLEQIYNSIWCNTKVLSSKIIIVSKTDRVWPRNAIITDCRSSHGTLRKGHKLGIIHALTVQYICIFQVPLPFNVNKLCSDKTKIFLNIGPAYWFLSCELYVWSCITSYHYMTSHDWTDCAGQYRTWLIVYVLEIAR